MHDELSFVIQFMVDSKWFLFLCQGNTIQQVVALVHSDVHDEATIKVIQSRVPTIIHLRPSSTHHHMHGCVIQHSELWKKSTEWASTCNLLAYQWIQEKNLFSFLFQALSNVC